MSSSAQLSTAATSAIDSGTDDDLSIDGVLSVTVVLCVLLLGAGLFVVLKDFLRMRALRIQARSGQSGARESLTPSVITLHAVTPGQAPYEYNVGDERGSRGR